jgi:hypothetical protein
MARWLRFWMFVVLVPAGLAIMARPPIHAQATGPEVDVALVLAVDISFSMDIDELALQRDGYVQAIRSAQVKQAIAKGSVGKIAVTFVEWAGLQAQYVVIPWTILDSPQAAEAFAEKLAEAPTRRGRRTSVSGAIDLGVKMLAESGVTPLKKVIDISGDGPNNEGRPVTEARADALAKGISINGLPIMLKPPGYFDIADLDLYYEDCVIGGPGAFSIAIREKSQFVEAVRTKLVLEMALAPVVPPISGGPQVVPAQARTPRVSCMIGERQWRDRMGN